MNGIAKRVEGGNHFLGNSGVDLVHIACRDGEKLSERSLSVHPHAKRVRAQVLSTAETVAAAPADDVSFSGNQIAGLQVGHSGTNGFNNATELMAHGHRHGDCATRPRVPFVNVHIGAANRCFANADQCIHRTGFRFGNVLQPDSRFRFGFDECFHVAWRRGSDAQEGLSVGIHNQAHNELMTRCLHGPQVIHEWNFFSIKRSQSRVSTQVMKR